MFQGHPAATADFFQGRNKLASKVQGALQKNGDFIFYVLDGTDRKMVRTSNMGTTFKIGMTPKAANTWENHYTWGNVNSDFRIENFKGSEGIYYYS